MKKYLILITLVSALAIPGEACDVCGCSLGGNYFGILPLYNKNFIGLRWSQAKFHAYVAATQYLNAEYSDDTYSKVELWGRFYVTKRLQVFAFIPYAYNNMDGTDQKISADGLGDINVMTNYLLVNTGEEMHNFKHTLLVGGGIKLPTGKFDLTDQGKIVNRNFQMGTGSIDFNVNAVYTVRYRRAGINLETGYKINTRNSDHYLFGNQYRASAQLFYWQQLGVFSLLPHAGFSFEQAEKHKDGDIIQVNTGGSATLASAGLDVYVGRFTLGVNFQRPVSQRYNSDDQAEIKGGDRWTTSLTFNF